MKKFFISMMLASISIFASSFTLAQELGDFCWQSNNDSCVLKLHATQHDTFFLFLGKLSCPGENLQIRDNFRPVRDVDSHVRGSGYINGNQIKIGLDFIHYGIAIPFEGFVEDTVLFQEVIFGDINLSDLSFNGISDQGASLRNYTNIVCGV